MLKMWRCIIRLLVNADKTQVLKHIYSIIKVMVAISLTFEHDTGPLLQLTAPFGERLYLDYLCSNLQFTVH